MSRQHWAQWPRRMARSWSADVIADVSAVLVDGVAVDAGEVINVVCKSLLDCQGRQDGGRRQCLQRDLWAEVGSEIAEPVGGLEVLERRAGLSTVQAIQNHEVL